MPTFKPLVWDEDTKRLYETGVDRPVLYVIKNGAYSNGVAWNGLTKVTESPSGGDETKLYANNGKYGSLRAAEDFGGTIECYTYPDEWMLCDGSAEIAKGVMAAQQTRAPFGFSYRTMLANDSAGQDYGYKLHLVYGATASPSSKDFDTVNDSPEAITFSYEFTTTPVAVKGHKKTSLIVIDSTKMESTKLKLIEDKLYGTTTTAATLPMPDEIMTMIAA